MCSWLRRRVGKESTSPRSGSVPVPASASNVLPTWDTCTSISISCVNCHPCHVDSFFKAGEQLLPRKEQEWGKVQVCFKKLENFKWFVSRSFAPLDIVQEKDNLTFPAEYCTIQFWESQNEWKHPTFYQPSPRPGQNDPLIFFLVSSWTNVITTKWWFSTHALLFFNNVPYVMQGTHDFND